MSVVLRPVNPSDLGPVPVPRPETRPRPSGTIRDTTVDTRDGSAVDQGAAGTGAARSIVAITPVGRAGGVPWDGAEGCTLRVVAWPDPIIDRLGYDPRSLYVETFWLGVLGPTSTWLLRRLAARFDDDPTGFDMDLDDTARTLGLGGRSGRHAPFRRALARCMTFEAARRQGPSTLAVRRKLPPLPRRLVQRLPASLQAEHDRWLAAARRSPALDEVRRRSRRLALGLLEAGGAGPAVEAQLVRWQVHPSMAHEATEWARAARTDDRLGTQDAEAGSGGGLRAGARP